MRFHFDFAFLLIIRTQASKAVACNVCPGVLEPTSLPPIFGARHRPWSICHKMRVTSGIPDYNSRQSATTPEIHQSCVGGTHASTARVVSKSVVLLAGLGAKSPFRVG